MKEFVAQKFKDKDQQYIAKILKEMRLLAKDAEESLGKHQDDIGMRILLEASKSFWFDYLLILIGFALMFLEPCFSATKCSIRPFWNEMKGIVIQMAVSLAFFLCWAFFL